MRHPVRIRARGCRKRLSAACSPIRHPRQRSQSCGFSIEDASGVQAITDRCISCQCTALGTPFAYDNAHGTDRPVVYSESENVVLIVKGSIRIGRRVAAQAISCFDTMSSRKKAAVEWFRRRPFLRVLFRLLPVAQNGVVCHYAGPLAYLRQAAEIANRVAAFAYVGDGIQRVVVQAVRFEVA